MYERLESVAQVQRLHADTMLATLFEHMQARTIIVTQGHLSHSNSLPDQS